MIRQNGIVVMTDGEYKNMLKKSRMSMSLNCKHKTIASAVNEIKGDRSIREMSEYTGIAASYISGMLKGQYCAPSLEIMCKITDPSSNPQGNVTPLELFMILLNNTESEVK